MLAISSWIVLLIYMAPGIFAQECSINISNQDYRFIDEMISTQPNLCKIPVKILNKESGTENCDRWAQIYEVQGLLEKLNFIPNTKNYNNTYDLKQTYISCWDQIQSDEMDALNIYLQTSYMNTIEILQKVNDSLHKLEKWKACDFPSECISYYETHGHHNNDVSKGPPCTCPSPTTSISSSEASQTSLSYLSELASSTHTTSYFLHSSSLAEGMSGSYPEKLISHSQTNSQGLDYSPFISPNTPSDVKPLTTTVDHLYTGVTEQSGAYTNFPPTISDFTVPSTEFTKGGHEPSYVTLNPSQTRTDSEQVNTSTSDTESTYGFSITVEPNERQETTMTEFASQSPKGSVFHTFLPVPSKEPSIETSSISVTKIRRSLANTDDISSAAVTAQAVSSLSTSANDPNLPSQNSVYTSIPSSGMGLSNTEAPELVSQGKVTMDRDLGWVSSYFSSTMLTTETELSMSSPTPGDKLPLTSDVIHNPMLNSHPSYNNPPQQERDIAIDDRQNSSSDPTQDSNKLPLIAIADGRNGELTNTGGHGNIQMIIIAILGVLVLLLLCGFLYYRHQYWVLKRRLNRSCDVNLTRNPGAVLPDERVHLHVIECDVV